MLILHTKSWQLERFPNYCTLPEVRVVRRFSAALVLPPLELEPGFNPATHMRLVGYTNSESALIANG
jgi:hypothetical protein